MFIGCPVLFIINFFKSVLNNIEYELAHSRINVEWNFPT